MKIACFTMIKNEASMLAPFCDQLNEFFDLSIIIDHHSSDNSIEIIEQRCDRAVVFSLASTAYPQAELATFVMKSVFTYLDVNHLFFLDCDEYLPFASRQELIDAIVKAGGGGLYRLHWRNISPKRFDGQQVFGGGFVAATSLSPFAKISVTRPLFERHPNLGISQGYHRAVGIPRSVTSTPLSPLGLLHLPIPSRSKYEQKISHSAPIVLRTADLLKNRSCIHWVEHADALARAEMPDYEKIALRYPDLGSGTPGKMDLEFGFDYVRSEFDELLVLQGQSSPQKGDDGIPFSLIDRTGHLIWDARFPASEEIEHAFSEAIRAGQDRRPEAAASLEGEGIMQAPLKGLPANLDAGEISRVYTDLIAPLFSLPRKLPMTAWYGHIPFLFVLFRTLRPRSYVELGVHTGASLIAAATAARACNSDTALYGVDTWQGDEHAGIYSEQSEAIYGELKNYLHRFFKSTKLLKMTFDEARANFRADSIDMLHIDGFHTYEAVHHDFHAWKDALRSNGVVLFHDIAVHSGGFGVWKLWEELKTHYPTIEFKHCFGLGVLFISQQPNNLGALELLLRNPELFDGYRNLVADIAEMLPMRCSYLSSDGDSRLQELRDHFESSTSWKITAPFRSLRRAITR
jgi:Methyltransferase domain/Glycosyl transferase family 2